jgi:hypothetical protein
MADVATIQIVTDVVPDPNDPTQDIAIIAGVEVPVPAGSLEPDTRVILVEGATTSILSTDVLPNPPIGEMLIQHEGMDVTTLVL